MDTSVFEFLLHVPNIDSICSYLLNSLAPRSAGIEPNRADQNARQLAAINCQLLVAMTPRTKPLNNHKTHYKIDLNSGLQRLNGSLRITSHHSGSNSSWNTQAI